MKQQHLDTLWFCAFRYSVSRTSYIVSEFEEAFLTNFNEVPDKTKKLILRELRYAFKQDEITRYECDRASWQNVLNKLEEWEKL